MVKKMIFILIAVWAVVIFDKVISPRILGDQIENNVLNRILSPLIDDPTPTYSYPEAISIIDHNDSNNDKFSKFDKSMGRIEENTVKLNKTFQTSIYNLPKLNIFKIGINPN